MGEAAGDVDRVELEICLERRRESFQLREQAPLEAAAPKLGPLSPPVRGSG
jgi:hypothetical protein